VNYYCTLWGIIWGGLNLGVGYYLCSFLYQTNCSNENNNNNTNHKTTTAAAAATKNSDNSDTNTNYDKNHNSGLSSEITRN
jgi:hypothetical protein